MGRRQQGADQRDEAMDCSPSLLYGDCARELQPTFLDGGFIPCPFPPVPAGFHTLTPYMTITGAPRAIEFLQKAFGAEELNRTTMPDGTIVNAELKIGDSMVYLAEARGYGPRPSTIYLYVKDCDAFYRSAIQAGATSIMEPADQAVGAITLGSCHSVPKSDAGPLPPGSRGKPGLGLGLMLVKGIAEAHGGGVDFRSSAELGTAFTVRLPLEPEQSG